MTSYPRAAARRWLDGWTAGFFDEARRRALEDALDRSDVSLQMLLVEDPCLAEIGLSPGQRSALARGLKLWRESMFAWDSDNEDA